MTYITCLIGDGSPSLPGTGLPAGAVPRTAVAEGTGQQAYAVLVHAPNWTVRSFSAGRGMKATVPCIKPPMYSCRLRGVAVPGKGPRGFAAEVTPLPLATTSVRPSRDTRTLVGYQPTGMKPSDCAWPAVETSKIATSLLFAFATKSVFSSGVSATLFGIVPGGELGNSAALSVSVTLPLAVSITLTVLKFDSATKSRPSRPSAISFGCSPIFQVARSAPVFASSTRTADL